MKKIGILLIAATFLFSCDPIENRKDMGTTEITEADLAKISATPVMMDSKANPGTQVRSNYIVLNSEGIPVLSSWFYGTGTYVGTNDTVQVVVPGKQTITFTGLGPDGTKLTREVEIEVDECFDVAAQWGYLCGEGSRVWTWNEDESAVFGNGGYNGNVAPSWWALGVDQMDEQAAGEGRGATMEFSVVGSTFVKTLTDGTKQTGTFGFSYADTDKIPVGAENPWAEGKLNINGSTVLAGHSGGRPAFNTYHILRLTDEYMNLAAAAPGTGDWGEAWFFLFKAQ